MQTIKGSIDRVFFYAEDSGYAVCLFATHEEEKKVTIAGNILNPKENDELELTGQWVKHPKYGDQFKVESYLPVMPATPAGIEKYLGSGLLPGIGPATAKKLVEKFGEGIFDILDQDPEALIEIPGISKKKIEKIKEAWGTHRGTHIIMTALMAYGITMAYAIKIFKKYGGDAIAKIEDNPFILCEIKGIGFAMADKIAMANGFTEDHPERLESGVLHALTSYSLNGHVYCPYDNLLSESNKLLSIDTAKIEEAISSLRDKNRIVEIDGEGRPVYVPWLYHYEQGIAFRVLEMLQEKISKIDVKIIDQGIHEIEKGNNITLADQQREAVQTACRNIVSIISGGPGTGKTTILSAICKAAESAGRDIVLAAPTGRAAKRMAESTGLEAKTIHRLLVFGEGGFQKNSEDPLSGDFFIVDESSMIDTSLMYHFLDAVPGHAQVLFVGDIHQLPSVGPGNVLKNLIESNQIPVVHLSRVFRQNEGSGISTAAHDINQGVIPQLPPWKDDSDFIFVSCSSNEGVQDRIIRLAKGLPGSQVLSPMKKGDLGTWKLNELLQKTLNPNKAEKLHPVSQTAYAEGDRVLQMKNNYEKDVFNGDGGVIQKISKEDQTLSVDYGDGQIVDYGFSELDQIALAYAITIHKSQGSEYPVVIMPMIPAFYVMLARNLVYTGITRGKQRVIIVGQKKSIEMAVKNDRVAHRYTLLKELLMPQAA